MITTGATCSAQGLAHEPIDLVEGVGCYWPAISFAQLESCDVETACGVQRAVAVELGLGLEAGFGQRQRPSLESAPRCLPAPTLTRCPLDCIHLRHTTPLAANYSYRPHTSLPCPHTSRPPTCLVSWIAMRLLGAQCNRHAKHALTHCCCVDFEGIASKLFTMQQSSSAPRTYYSIRAVHRVLLQDLRYRPFSACASLRM